MSITIQQIAEEAGVSRGTVDRALNNRGRINPEVAERIRQIAASKGYVSRKNKKTASSSIRIGVVTFLSGHIFSQESYRGIQLAKEELEQWGIEILIRTIESAFASEEVEVIDELIEEGIDGLAIMPIDSELVRNRLNRVTAENQIPIVTFNTDIVGTHRICFVGMDNRKSGRVAAGLMGMLTRGSGNLLILTGSFSNYAYSCRVDGFIEELKENYPLLQIAAVQCTFDDEKDMAVVLRKALLENSIGGILVTSAGQEAVEKIFRDLNMDRRPYVVFYDRTPCTERALSEDLGDFVIEQDCFSQGYQAAYTLANLLVKHQEPSEEFHFTQINILTKYNM